MESYYLYHCGLPLGPGVGLMTLQYVSHKTTVLLYATVMLLLQHRWLAANTSGVMHYLPAAYCVVALVIVTLVLLCVSPLVQRLEQGDRVPPRRCARCLKSCDPGKVPYCITHALIRAVQGDVENGLFFCGSNVGRLDKMRSVKELIDEVMTEWRMQQ